MAALEILLYGVGAIAGCAEEAVEKYKAAEQLNEQAHINVMKADREREALALRTVEHFETLGKTKIKAEKSLKWLTDSLVKIYPKTESREHNFSNFNDLATFTDKANKAYGFVALNQKHFDWIGAKGIAFILAAPLTLGLSTLLLSHTANGNMEKALTNQALSRKYCEEIETIKRMFLGMVDRSCLYDELIKKYDSMLLSAVEEVDYIIQKNGDNLKHFSGEDRKKIAMAYSMAEPLSALIDIDIIDEERKLTEISLQLYNEKKTTYDSLRYGNSAGSKKAIQTNDKMRIIL
jgi:hypothetical protein